MIFWEFLIFLNLNLNFEFGPVSYRTKPEPVRLPTVWGTLVSTRMRRTRDLQVDLASFVRGPRDVKLDSGWEGMVWSRLALAVEERRRIAGRGEAAAGHLILMEQEGLICKERCCLCLSVLLWTETTELLL